jgi:hypothetical protein
MRVQSCLEHRLTPLSSSRAPASVPLRSPPEVDANTFINCVACGPAVSGGMLTKPDGAIEIVMCGNNRIKSFHHYETVLTHELIHAFDVCRAEIDLTNLQHHACTEVRAANLSGDCSFVHELKMTGNLSITKHQPVCEPRGKAARGHRAVRRIDGAHLCTTRRPLCDASSASDDETPMLVLLLT